MTGSSVPRGGSFLVEEASDAFTPEDFGDERLAIKDAVDDFGRKELAPRAAELDRHDDALLVDLMRRAGALGFLGVDVPEEFGGLGLDLVTSALVTEAIGGAGSASFAVTFAAHTGIGTWPILYFGSDEQRRAHLPGIASGERLAAYALTEPGSGSDALGAKTTAVLSEDGAVWTVNGSKIFITNGGFADVFTVFVKIAGQNACLIVEKGAPGFSVGKEESKMGIRGSSTVPLSFDDARVPAANLLGAVGRGHKVVFNTLNLGRFKLGAAAVGGLKASLAESVAYAAGRKQFGRPILSFDAMRGKVADIAASAWAGESMVYRVAGLLDRSLHGIAPGEAAAKAIEELTIECSIVKVALSEMLDRAVDEAVQVHGGYGFIEEYPVARAYRDSRINRIFEGTNEINRMLAVGEALKRAMQGRLDLMPAIAGADAAPQGDADAVRALRQATLFTLGRAVQKHMMAIEKEQQVLLALADAAIALYEAESSRLRLAAMGARGAGPVPAHAAADALCAARAVRRAGDSCEAVLASVQAPPSDVAHLRRILEPCEGADVIGLRRTLADAVEAKGGYPF